MLDVALVGTGGMMPLEYRWLAAGAIRYNGTTILIDCGEGTQIPFKRLAFGFVDVSAILFTHYHADHVAGLPGMLLAMANAGKTTPLILMGPPYLRQIVDGITIIVPKLPYKIIFREVLGDRSTVNIGGILISNLAVNHGMPCVCYSFEIKRQGEFNVDKAKELGIPVKFWNRLQKGEGINYNDIPIGPEMVLGPERKGLKISYCVDTRPTNEIADFIQGSDLFICEGMYGDDADLIKAKEKGHMTFREAATLARLGNVSELWLTHFSPAMPYPNNYERIAMSIFPNTHIGKDMQSKKFKFRG